MAKGERRACPACGTWKCRTCGKTRSGLSRFVIRPLDCNGCGSVDGLMVPVLHTSRGKALDHEEETPHWVRLYGVPRYPLVGYTYTPDSSKER